MNTSQMPPFDFDVSKFPPLPHLKGVFVTGTDTEVGKTIVAGAIASCLRRRGRGVEVFKPVATGCRYKRGQWVSEDAEFLAACADSRRTLSEIVPLRFARPLSPNVAAQLQRCPVDLEEIFNSYRRLCTDASDGMHAGGPGAASVGPEADGALCHCDAVIVEGTGGLLCPISDDFWVIHLAKLMQLPLVIVARAGLGTINHTLLTLHAARSAGLVVAGVILNRYLPDPPTAGEAAADALHSRGDVDLAMHTNAAQVADRGKVKVLALVPDEPQNSVEKIVIGPDTDFAISQVPWEKIMGI